MKNTRIMSSRATMIMIMDSFADGLTNSSIFQLHTRFLFSSYLFPFFMYDFIMICEFGIIGDQTW